MKRLLSAWMLYLICASYSYSAEETYEWKITQKNDPFEDFAQVDAELEGSGIVGSWLRLRCRNKKPYLFTTINGANLDVKKIIRGKLRINHGEIREGDWVVLSAPASFGQQIIFTPLSRKTFSMFQTLTDIAIRISDTEKNREWTLVFAVPKGSDALKPVFETCPIEDMQD